jgi:hypothetical protein
MEPLAESLLAADMTLVGAVAAAMSVNGAPRVMAVEMTLEAEVAVHI